MATFWWRVCERIWASADRVARQSRRFAFLSDFLFFHKKNKVWIIVHTKGSPPSTSSRSIRGKVAHGSYISTLLWSPAPTSCVIVQEKKTCWKSAAGLPGQEWRQKGVELGMISATLFSEGRRPCNSFQAKAAASLSRDGIFTRAQISSQAQLGFSLSARQGFSCRGWSGSIFINTSWFKRWLYHCFDVILVTSRPELMASLQYKAYWCWYLFKS